MAKKTKKELGLGIKALLSGLDQTQTSEKAEIVQQLSGKIALVPIDFITHNPFQPRKEFDEEALEELKESIATHGLIQPVTLRRLDDQNYQLISGERRWRAAKLAGLDEIPAYIRLADDQGMIEMALIENIQRADLNAIEIAIGYQRLMEECDLTQEMLSGRLGKKRSTIANYLRLLNLPPTIQKSIKSGQISMGHARVLAGVKSMTFQLDLHNKVISSGLSVRQLEQMASRNASAIPTVKEEEKSPEMELVNDKLSAHFGTKVQIRSGKSGAGKIVIPFKSVAQLNDILDSMDL